LAQTNTAVAVGAFYDFKIRDNGTNLLFYVGDMQNPALSISTTETFGNRVGFYNREDGQQSELRWIEIESMQPTTAIPSKYAGEYFGVAAPTPLDEDCDERGLVDLRVASSGFVIMELFNYSQQLIAEGMGTIDSKGAISLTLNGSPVEAQVSASGSSNLKFSYHDCKYSGMIYRRFKDAYNP